jgi:hypothetical protein
MNISCKERLLGLFLAMFISVPALAEGNRAETKYFSAEIVNVRRANTGNVIVTIKFIPKIDEVARLYIYSDIKQNFGDGPCPNNQTVLIDGNGDEHTARNCLPPYVTNGNNNHYTDGMQLHAASEATFVYKFGLAGTSSESLKGMNLTIPMRYSYCYLVDFYSQKRFECAPSPISLSFYGINAN